MVLRSRMSLLNLTLSLKIIHYAKRFVDRRYYRYSLYRGLDCSSFTQAVFAKYGVELYRTSLEQSRQGMKVDKRNLRAGDLLFFYVPGRYRSRKIVGHVAIYVGRNKMIHCIPHSKIVIRDLDKPHWRKTYLFAKRII
ncbi:MAG: C40 family peptidase [Candidatus Pristimantibacillus sp.]